LPTSAIADLVGEHAGPLELLRHAAVAHRGELVLGARRHHAQPQLREQLGPPLARSQFEGLQQVVRAARGDVGRVRR
jgi:hypothetical protein